MGVGKSSENPGFGAGDWEVKSCRRAAIVHRQVIKKQHLSHEALNKDGVKVVTVNPPAAL